MLNSSAGATIGVIPIKAEIAGFQEDSLEGAAEGETHAFLVIQQNHPYRVVIPVAQVVREVNHVVVGGCF